MTNAKQLSNKEREYRSKIIAENHLNKKAQKYLDKYKSSKNLTYKEIYMSYALLSDIAFRLYFVNINKLNEAVRNFGTTIEQATSGFKNLANALNQSST